MKKKSYTPEQIADYEFWKCLEITLRMSGYMPSYSTNEDDYAYGLCDCVSYGSDRSSYVRRFKQVESIRPKNLTDIEYFWPKGEVDPRIKACARLAKIALTWGNE